MSRMNLSNSFEDEEVQPDTDDSSEEEDEPQAKKRKISYDYENIQRFETDADLAAYRITLKTAGLYLKNEVIGEKAKVYTYSCNESRRGCNYILIIRAFHDNLSSQVTHRTCGHDHTRGNAPKLNKEVKKYIHQHSKHTAAQIQQGLIVSFGVAVLFIIYIFRMLTCLYQRKLKLMDSLSRQERKMATAKLLMNIN